MARAREQADLLEELRAGAAVHLIEASQALPDQPRDVAARSLPRRPGRR
jgi:hypothetical protein